jgi:hypothetical protein
VTRWEYRTLAVRFKNLRSVTDRAARQAGGGVIEGLDPADLAALNGLGAEGWEAYAAFGNDIVGVVLLKRPA